MKMALRPDMWPRAELKLQWFDKLLMTVVSTDEFDRVPPDRLTSCFLRHVTLLIVIYLFISGSDLLTSGSCGFRIEMI